MYIPPETWPLLSLFAIAFAFLFALRGKRRGSRREPGGPSVEEKVEWAAYRAEVANASIELVRGRLRGLDSELQDLRESLKTGLEASVELQRLYGDQTRTAERLALQPSMHTSSTGELPTAVGASATLTPTETSIVEMLAASSGMTSREIQQRVGRTREHVSRLMKKLTEEGVVARERAGNRFVYKASGGEPGKHPGA